MRESQPPPPQRRGQGCAPPAQPVLQGTGHGGEPCSPWGSQKLGFQHSHGQLRLPAGAQPPRQPRKRPLAPTKPGSTIQRAISQWQKKGTCQGEAEGRCRRHTGHGGGPGQPRCSPPGSPAAGPGVQHSATSASSLRNLAPRSPAASPPAFLPPGESPSGRGSPSRSPHAGLLHTSGSLLAQGARPDPSPTQLLLPTPPKPPSKNKAGKEKNSYCCFFFASQPRASSLLRTPAPPPAGRDAPVVRAAQTAEPSPKNISYRQQEEVARPLAPSLQSTASRGEVWEEKAAPGEGRRLESLQHRRRAVPTGRQRVWGRLSGGRWRRRPGRKSSW